MLRDGGFECVAEGGAGVIQLSDLEPGDVITVTVVVGTDDHVYIYAGDGYIYDQFSGVIMDGVTNVVTPIGDKYLWAQQYLNRGTTRVFRLP